VLTRILVADDEEELLELIRFSLDVAGYHVTTAKNGKIALELSRKEKFDLVILDVMMPQMDGYHACSEISQDPTNPPVILLTSRDFDQDQAAVKGSGASAFLSKPFEIPELLKVVKDLTKTRSV
jgi:CheY-like chemotaxis protein